MGEAVIVGLVKEDMLVMAERMHIELNDDYVSEVLGRVKEYFEQDSRFWQGLLDTVRYGIEEVVRSRDEVDGEG